MIKGIASQSAHWMVQRSISRLIFLAGGGAGSAILILRNENINELNGLFLAAVLREALTKYSYADQLNSQTITLESIQLPVASNKEPDWHYMENYMETVLKETAANLDKLRGN